MQEKGKVFVSHQPSLIWSGYHCWWALPITSAVTLHCRPCSAFVVVCALMTNNRHSFQQVSKSSLISFSSWKCNVVEAEQNPRAVATHTAPQTTLPGSLHQNLSAKYQLQYFTYICNNNILFIQSREKDDVTGISNIIICAASPS